MRVSPFFDIPGIYLSRAVAHFRFLMEVRFVGCCTKGMELPPQARKER